MKDTWGGIALMALLAVGCDCGGGDTPPVDECTEDMDCTAANPWCVNRECVQCRTGADCAGPGQSCNAANECVGGSTDAGSGGTDAGGDAGGTMCVGAPPQCCTSTMTTVDAACAGTTWTCPAMSTMGACEGECLPISHQCCRNMDGSGGSVPPICADGATVESCPPDSFGHTLCCTGANPGCCLGGGEPIGDAMCNGMGGWRCDGEASPCGGDA